MLHDPTRMEKLLEVWEDSWYLLGCSQRLADMCRKLRLRLVYSLHQENDTSIWSAAPIQHWRSFRKYLASVAGSWQGDEAFLDPRFTSGNTSWNHVNTLGKIASDLYGWCMTSKRVFALDQDIQLLLGATSLGKLTWSDVMLPFPCFAIKLAEPIATREKEVDFLVVRHNLTPVPDGMSPTINITAVPRCVSGYKPITALDKQQLDRAIERGHAKRAATFYNRLADSPVENLPHNLEVRNYTELMISRDIRLDEFNPTTTVDGIKPDKSDTGIVTRLLRTVAGLCLYLKTLPNDSPHLKGIPSDIVPTPRGMPVTNAQEALLVTCESVLSTQDQDIIRDLNNEIDEDSQSAKRGEYSRPRYRSGYWHRPRGKGSDAFYPKTLWTKPTIARRDLIAKGLVPLGSQTTIR